MILKLCPEFAHEIVLGIPYAYWLSINGQLNEVYTSMGMKSFYYFCDNVHEVYTSRSLDFTVAGLDALPNTWIHHNALAVTGKSYTDLSDQERADVNGVLDYTQWIPPPYSEEYKNDDFDFGRYVIINNTYNVEFGRTNEKPRRYFSEKALAEMFFHFQKRGYNVIYKRPDNTEFTTDQNETITKQLGWTFNDYQLCNDFDNVINMNDIFKASDYSYNELQLKLFSGADGFITTNGGGGILCAYFDQPVIMYVPDGKETRPQYLTNKDSYINKLSEAQIIPVFDDRKFGVNNYTELFEVIKIF